MTSKNNKPKEKKTTVEMTDETYKKLKMIALEQDSTFKNIVQKFLEYSIEHLDDIDFEEKK